MTSLTISLPRSGLAGVGDWLFARPLQWRLGVQVVAIDPSAAFRKALRMSLPRTAVSVDAFHLVKLGNDMLTEVRQCLTQQVHGRRGRSIDPVWGLFTVRGDWSAVMGGHAAVLAALRNRIRVL